MPTIYLSAGSNLDDRQSCLDRAVELLKAAGIRVCGQSATYETEPVGFADQPWFLNRVIEADTALSPAPLLAACREIERVSGRVRTFVNGPRTLDLDILLYGSLALYSADLLIPHPRMTERRFVLEPMAEIAPDLRHPVLDKTMRTLLSECRDSSTVRLFSPGDCPDAPPYRD